MRTLFRGGARKHRGAEHQGLRAAIRTTRWPAVRTGSGGSIVGLRRDPTSPTLRTMQSPFRQPRLRVALAFGMDVVAWSPHLTPARADAAGVRLAASKPALLEQADIVSIHLVLSERTRGLVTAKEVALMKPTAFLINTSRGPVVEEAALLSALGQRRIAGAGLDVFDLEPLPGNHPLRRLENVVLTPHLGYVTQENYRIYYAQMVEDIQAWIAGKPVRELKK